MATFVPLQDRVIVKRVKEEEKTKGGIIIPDTAKEKPIEGEVIAVGNGKVLEDGKVRKLDVKVGDRVLFGKYSGHRGEDRRRGAPHPPRGRHPRRPREVIALAPQLDSRFQERDHEHGCQRNRLHRERAQPDPRAASTPSPTRSRSPSAPRAATSSSRRASARPTVTKDGVTVAKEIELENKLREHGRADGARGRLEDERRRRRRHHHRDRARAGDLPRGLASSSPPGHNPMEIKRGIDKAVEAIVARAQEAGEADQGPEGDRAGRHHQRQRRRRRSASMLAEAMEKVGKEGVITVEEAKTAETDARRRRGHAVRPRLPLAVLRHRPGADGGRARGRRTSSSARRRSRT